MSVPAQSWSLCTLDLFAADARWCIECLRSIYHAGSPVSAEHWFQLQCVKRRDSVWNRGKGENGHKPCTGTGAIREGDGGNAKGNRDHQANDGTRIEPSDKLRQGDALLTEGNGGHCRQYCL